MDPGPTMKQVVVRAIEDVRWDNPSWFSYGDPNGWIIVLKPNDFMKAVIARINSWPPYKAAFHHYEPESTITIKENDELSENYAILGGPNGIRRAYGGTCYPAEF
jgi:hypothetical protein